MQLFNQGSIKITAFCLSSVSAKTESENNRPAAQGAVTEMGPAER